MAQSAEKVSILGSNISIWDLEETVAKLRELCAGEGHHYVCVSNVHTVVMGLEDPAFARVTNEAALATADGVPLVWASRVVGPPEIHGRSNGPDIMEKMLRDSQAAHLRHYFYGSTPEVLEALKSTIHEMAPRSKLVGFQSPPKRPAKAAGEPLDADELADCRRIDEASPDIVWVGLGAPKQELWMHRARSSLKAPVLIGVGAAFDICSGRMKRAPQWMQNNGLEWAYRFALEPRRLASRYLKTNPLFVAAVARQALLGRHSK